MVHYSLRIWFVKQAVTQPPSLAIAAYGPSSFICTSAAYGRDDIGSNKLIQNRLTHTDSKN